MVQLSKGQFLQWELKEPDGSPFCPALREPRVTQMWSWGTACAAQTESQPSIFPLHAHTALGWGEGTHAFLGMAGPEL